MNQMKREILNLIGMYFSKGKFPDRNYIVSLIEIIVKYRDLGDYLDPAKTKFLNRDGRTIADYSSEASRRNINVFWGEVQKTLDMVKNSNDVNFNSAERLYDALFQLGETVYHETEHAYQIKLIESGTASFESIILTRSYDLCKTLPPELSVDEQMNLGLLEFYIYKLKEEYGIAKANFLYNRHYQFAPEERLANIRALEVTLDILKCLEVDKKDELKSFYNFRRCRLLFESLKAYKKQSAPTMYYFKKLGLLDDEMSEILACEDFDMDERISYGLYIPRNEFAKRWQEKEELKSSLKRK